MRPYVSGRAGRMQWLLQRASAVLLIVFAFTHFGMQHFTTNAVSTGLTVAARMDDRLWQAYYAVFIALALFHGVNGLIGIIADYAPRQLLRNTLTTILWTGAAFMLAVALINLADSRPLEAVKVYYSDNGFPEGASAGNPPALPVEYSMREEMRELHLLAHYLDKYTHGAPADLSTVFANDGTVAASVDEAAELARAGGLAFEQWARQVIEQGPPPVAERDRSRIFSSTYEFAVWALNVRSMNADQRGKPAIARRLADIPDYQQSLH
ncbi:MAG: hypothetical protein ACOCXJ_05230 [Planctomycetota bacterium]